MLWLILSLFSALSQATRDLFSKKGLESLDEYLISFSIRLFALPFLIPLFFLTERPNVDSLFLVTLLLASGLISVASILYMRAIKMSPLSLTIPILAFTPLFLLLTSPLMLGEFPNSLGLLGILLIVVGTYTLSISDARRSYIAPFKGLLKEKGSLLMLLVSALFSIVANLIKIGVQQSNPFFFSTIFYAFTSSLLLPVMLTNTKEPTKKIGANITLLLTIGLFGALMSIFAQNAMERVMVPYVIATKRTNIVFSTLYGYFFFKEKRITERLIGALIMLSGVALISFS